MTDEKKSETQTPRHDALPLPDYDHLPTEALQQRIRTLAREELQQVLAYEEAHANRLPIVRAMQARLQELDAGATPSGGAPGGLAPEQAPGAAGGSVVSPQTAGPPVNPPSHGTPQNPAQPR
jgi:hypothetical protein